MIAWLILLVAALVPFTMFDALSLRPAALASLASAPFLIVTMEPRLARWLTEMATREQDDIVAALQPPSIERAKLAILSARGDEAGRWLRIWKVVSEAPLATGRVFGFDGWALTVAVIVLSLVWVLMLMVSSIVRRPGYWSEPLLANIYPRHDTALPIHCVGSSETLRHAGRRRSRHNLCEPLHNRCRHGIKDDIRIRKDVSVKRWRALRS